MLILFGALAILGPAILLVVLDASGSLSTAVERTIERLMSFDFITEVTPEEQAQFGTDKRKRQDKADDMVKYLTDNNLARIGAQIKMPVEYNIPTNVPADPKRTGNPEAHVENYDYIRGTDFTVRTMKRKIQAAAKQLGFGNMGWREPEGWLIGIIRESKVETTQETTQEEGTAPAAAPATTSRRVPTPPAAPATSSRRVPTPPTPPQPAGRVRAPSQAAQPARQSTPPTPPQSVETPPQQPARGRSRRA